MITKLEFANGAGKLLEGSCNGEAFALKFNELQPMWSYATEEDFEGGFAKAIGNKVLLCITTACGQGGVIVLWNAETKTVEHTSEASYCVAAAVFGENIYSLHFVSNYAIAAHFEVWKTPLGIMNAEQEGAKLPIDLSDLADLYDGDASALKFNVHSNEICIDLAGRKFSYATL